MWTCLGVIYTELHVGRQAGCTDHMVSGSRSLSHRHCTSEGRLVGPDAPMLHIALCLRVCMKMREWDI